MTVLGPPKKPRGRLRAGLRDRLKPSTDEATAARDPQLLSGHQALAQGLKARGITHVYSLPGNPVYATIAAFADAGLVTVGCRTQNGAMNAALAHNYRAGGLAAVALCSPAPGLTNSLTGLNDAYANQWPLILIAGGEEESSWNFQLSDAARMAAPFAKAVFAVKDRPQLSADLDAAVALAGTGPCGSVCLEVAPAALNGRASDVLAASTDTAKTTTPELQHIPAADRPVILLGEGLRWTAGDTAPLRAALEATGLPVLASPMARGILPDDHRQNVFAAGPDVLTACDQILLCGAQADWRFAGIPAALARLDPIEIPSEGASLVAQLKALPRRPQHQTWMQAMQQRQAEIMAQIAARASQPNDVARIIELSAALDQSLKTLCPDGVVSVIEGGLALSWGHLVWSTQQPFTRLTPGQNGTMGVGIPQGLGAALADPDQTVVVLVGDVGFGFAAAELETALRHKARLIVVVADNSAISGRAFQDRWMAPGSHDTLRFTPSVNYADIARGWGVPAQQIAGPAALLDALSAALTAQKTQAGPQVISVTLSADRPGPASEPDEPPNRLTRL